MYEGYITNTNIDFYAVGYSKPSSTEYTKTVTADARFDGFYVESVAANPTTVQRSGSATTELRVDWRDTDDPLATVYTVQFWVRETDGGIYGPFTATTVTKESSKQYNATYNLDPEDTWDTGYYDIEVAVWK